MHRDAALISSPTASKMSRSLGRRVDYFAYARDATRAVRTVPLLRVGEQRAGVEGQDRVDKAAVVFVACPLAAPFETPPFEPRA